MICAKISQIPKIDFIPKTYRIQILGFFVLIYNRKGGFMKEKLSLVALVFLFLLLLSPIQCWADPETTDEPPDNENNTSIQVVSNQSGDRNEFLKNVSEAFDLSDDNILGDEESHYGDAYDPIELVNRGTFSFNDNVIYRPVLFPVSDSWEENGLRICQAEMSQLFEDCFAFGFSQDGSCGIITDPDSTKHQKPSFWRCQTPCFWKLNCLKSSDNKKTKKSHESRIETFFIYEPKKLFLINHNPIAHKIHFPIQICPKKSLSHPFQPIDNPSVRMTEFITLTHGNNCNIRIHFL